MLQNGRPQITGTKATDSLIGNLSAAVHNVFLFSVVAFSIAVWVTVMVHWSGAGNTGYSSPTWETGQADYPEQKPFYMNTFHLRFSFSILA